MSKILRTGFEVYYLDNPYFRNMLKGDGGTYGNEYTSAFIRKGPYDVHEFVQTTGSDGAGAWSTGYMNTGWCYKTSDSRFASCASGFGYSDRVKVRVKDASGKLWVVCYFWNGDTAYVAVVINDNGAQYLRWYSHTYVGDYMLYISLSKLTNDWTQLGSVAVDVGSESSQWICRRVGVKSDTLYAEAAGVSLTVAVNLTLAINSFGFYTDYNTPFDDAGLNDLTGTTDNWLPGYLKIVGSTLAVTDGGNWTTPANLIDDDDPATATLSSAETTSTAQLGVTVTPPSGVTGTDSVVMYATIHRDAATTGQVILGAQVDSAWTEKVFIPGKTAVIPSDLGVKATLISAGSANVITSASVKVEAVLAVP